MTHSRQVWNNTLFAAFMASCASELRSIGWKQTRFTRNRPSSDIRRLLSRNTNLRSCGPQGYRQLLSRLCLAAVDMLTSTKSMASHCSCSLYQHLHFLQTILVSIANNSYSNPCSLTCWHVMNRAYTKLCLLCKLSDNNSGTCDSQGIHRTITGSLPSRTQGKHMPTVIRFAVQHMH